MGAFWFGIPDGLKLIIVLALGVGASFGAGYAYGRHHGSVRAAEAAAEAYSETLRRIEDADVDVSDPDAVLERLRELSE